MENIKRAMYQLQEAFRSELGVVPFVTLSIHSHITDFDAAKAIDFVKSWEARYDAQANIMTDNPPWGSARVSSHKAGFNEVQEIVFFSPNITAEAVEEWERVNNEHIDTRKG